MAYKIKEEPKQESQSFASKALDVGKTALAGAGAGVAGLQSSLFQTANLVAEPITKLLGQKTVPYDQTHVGKLYPSSNKHLQNIHELIPSTKPKNKVEEFSQNLTKDAVELFAPGQIVSKALKFGKYAFGPIRSLAISLGANLLGSGTEAFTGDKEKGNMVKNGSMLALSLFNPTSAKDVVKNLYQKSQQLLPENATSLATFSKGLNNLENKILKGRPENLIASSEKFVIDHINKFRQLIKDGKVDINQLVAQKRSFNEELQNSLFNIQNRSERARAKELAQGISHSVKETMQDYGKINPEWWKAQSSADKAFGAMAQSNFVSRALEKFMKGRPEGLAHAFGIGIPAGVSLVSGLGGASSVAAYQAAKIGMRIAKSKDLRNHYAKVVGAAAAGNNKITEKQLDILEKKLEDEPKNKSGRYHVKKNK